MDLLEWFLGDGRDEYERAVIARLRDRATVLHELGVRPEETQSWTDAPGLRVHVDVDDHEGHFIPCSLRVDFHGSHAIGGRSDPTLDGPLRGDPSERLDVQRDTVPELVECAVEWLARQLRRPLEHRSV